MKDFGNTVTNATSLDKINQISKLYIHTYMHLCHKHIYSEKDLTASTYFQYISD